MNRFTYLLAAFGIMMIPGLSLVCQPANSSCQTLHGAIVRGDTSQAELALVFTGDEFADGGIHIARVLADQGIKASFFLTGKFYRNPEFKSILQTLVKNGHYLGAHSDQHLLYCSWEKRDSLLLGQEEFQADLLENYAAMQRFGIEKEDAPFFLPPYEWYNDSIAHWTREEGLVLVNNTYGTLSHADYTLPGSRIYRSSKEIYQSITDYEESHLAGLNGFILLIHIGTEAKRTDKFYAYLEELIEDLKSRAYSFKRIDELLGQNKY